MTSQMITEKIEALPGTLQKEILDYIDFLLQKYDVKPEFPEKKFSFSWEGGLSDLKSAYTSVELQHKAAGWR